VVDCLTLGPARTTTTCVEWITRPSPTASPMMLLMLWRDCLVWLPPDCSLQTLWRGMELKGVLTRMTMNMDGEYIYKSRMHTQKKNSHTPPQRCHPQQCILHRRVLFPSASCFPPSLSTLTSTMAMVVTMANVDGGDGRNHGRR